MATEAKNAPRNEESDSDVKQKNDAVPARPNVSNPSEKGSNFFDAIPPILTYCLCSMSMIYINKYILSVLDFNYPLLVLSVQATLAVASLVVLDRFTNVVSLPALSLDVAIKWSPVTIFFGLMLFTGSMTIRLLSIPVLTVFKNMTNLLVAFGDWYLFGQTVTLGVFASFMMMAAGSILTGFNDLEFNLAGYIWMAINCMSQASYVLYMRHAKKTTKLSEWGMSLYNNLLSVPMLVMASGVSGEWSAASSYQHFSAGFFAALIFSGLIGTALSLSVFWAINATSPTTYTMVGATNKIPVTLISVVIFHVQWTWELAMSVSVGLLSGVVYAFSKYRLAQHRLKQAEASNQGSDKS